MAKRHPTLLYKLKIAFVLQLEDQKFPPEMAKNCLTQKLFNYLLFWGLAPKTTVFSQENAKKGVQKTLFLAKNCLKKKLFNYLLFSPLSSCNLWLCYGFLPPISPLSLPFFLSLSLTLSLPLSLSLFFLNLSLFPFLPLISLPLTISLPFFVLLSLSLFSFLSLSLFCFIFLSLSPSIPLSLSIYLSIYLI